MSPQADNDITDAPEEHNGRALMPFERAIVSAKARFGSKQLNYEEESIFAMQLLCKRSNGKQYALEVANNNPGSVKLAMLNVAATGLTLNPANKYAYLVPRDGEILLDISFKGLIKIATDSGAILWARADVVREKDVFTYRGPHAEPSFESGNVFGDRGEIVGGYCVAKTREGDILCEIMSKKQLYDVRACSDLFAKSGKGPWADFEEEMCKKTLIKRAAKTWPYTGKSGKLFEAIELASRAEGGYTFEGEAEIIPRELIGDDRKKRHDDAVEQYGDSITKIKDRLAAFWSDGDEDHVYTVAEIWQGIPQIAQMDLWLAPTKGGVFTTKERDFMKKELGKYRSTEEQPPCVE